MESEYQGKKEIKLQFQFLIIEDGEYQGERLFLKATAVISNFNNNPSWLYQCITALSGAMPSEDEQKEGVDGEKLNALISKQAIVLVKQSQGKNGKIYANIKGMTAAKALLPLPELRTKGPVPAPIMPDEPKKEEDVIEDDEEPKRPDDSSLPF